jgi:hypothetical protein
MSPRRGFELGLLRKHMSSNLRFFGEWRKFVTLSGIKRHAPWHLYHRCFGYHYQRLYYNHYQ